MQQEWLPGMYTCPSIILSMENLMQGRIQDFEMGGSYQVRAKRARKFLVTTPTFPKPRPF